MRDARGGHVLFREEGLRRTPIGLVVGIPTVNRYDKLGTCLARLAGSTVLPDMLFLVDNGGRLMPGVLEGLPFPAYVVKPGRNLGVAASWNLLMRFAADDQLVVVSDDLWLNSDGLERLWKSEAMFALGDIGWTCFKAKPGFRKEMGWFDEGFWPCNFEDVDMQKRMDIAGVVVGKVGNVGKHDEPYASQRPWGMKATESMNRVRRRFNAKWAGDKPWGGAAHDELDWCFEDFRANAGMTGLGLASHCDILKVLASRCGRVVEFGTGDGHSGVALLAGRPKELVTYDVAESPLAGILENVADGTSVRRRIESASSAAEHGDMLFVDAIRYVMGTGLQEVLRRHMGGFGRYVALRGVGEAWKGLVGDDLGWALAEEHKEGPGMVVLRRKGQ